MLNNQSYTVQLTANDLETLIKSLSASNVYHKDLDHSCFSEPDELQQIINKNKRLQSKLKSHLGSPFCPCPPETSPLDEVGGGIPARHMLLNETVSGGLSVTGNFLLSDLDELLKDYPVNGSQLPSNLE